MEIHLKKAVGDGAARQEEKRRILEDMKIGSLGYLKDTFSILLHFNLFSKGEIIFQSLKERNKQVQTKCEGHPIQFSTKKIPH